MTDPMPLPYDLDFAPVENRPDLSKNTSGMGGWSKIDTAPRDGRAILVMRDIWPGTASGRAEQCNGHNTYVAEWWGDEDSRGRWVCYMDAVQDPDCPIDPTHWMPLPSPPGGSNG